MRNPLYLFLLVGLVMALTVLAGLRVGSLDTDYGQVVEALYRYNPTDQIHFAIVNLRLPRMLLALVVGSSLAFAGYLMQAMVNNALADPYLLGTASGASLGAALAFFFLPAFSWAGIYLPPVFAMVGALAVTLLVVVLGYRKGQILPSQLLLAGIAISSLVSSFLALLTFLSDTESKLRTIIFWTMGSFDKASWQSIPLPAVAIALSLVLFTFLQKHLHLLLLGPDRAQTLGVPVAWLRWVILLTVSLVTGFAVSLSGPVGFVGLIVPHITRMFLGMAGRYNLLFCALAGGLFVMVCDLITRLVYPPVGLPIGIITSFFGVPFFVYLLVKKNYRFH